MITMRSVQETAITLSNGTINDPYDPLSLKMGVQNEPLLICRILNGHISATGDPIHFMFGSRVGFSGSADRMALFPVRSNPGWRPAAILENYSDIARFPRDSVDSFFDLLFFFY